MKTHKFIFTSFPKAPTLSLISLLTLISLTPPALSQEPGPEITEKVAFLQDIQNQLQQVSGIKNRPVTVFVTPESKRNITLTPTSVSFSYGFLKQMQDITQLVATMAHMTAHISLDFIETPPLDDRDSNRPEKTSVTDYIKNTLTQKFPDEGYIPQATGSFHGNQQNSTSGIIEKPSYQNKDYDYAVNRVKYIKAEHELEVDKVTHKIMRHAGYCAQDYTRLLQYFYENPHLLLGNEHFALDTDQWQRIDEAERRVTETCDADQRTQASTHAAAFDQMKVRILQSLRNTKKSD
ncbi:MAG: hypothetical protein COB54_04825 [Alphaproteobacteria bacterium]|nr:MAG: hypothetical protein COB54_04825 [Alphaproteobacteria bacterium]